MRALLILIVGIVIGAAGFHAFYFRQSAGERCLWDHPLDRDARSACRVREDAATAAQKQLDDLINTVGE